MCHVKPSIISFYQDLPQDEQAAVAQQVTDCAGLVRQTLHRLCIRIDERLCRKINLPELPDIDSKWGPLRKLFRELGGGELIAFYDNGLRVPRSVFLNRNALLLLSDKSSARRLVLPAFGLPSGRPLLIMSKEGDKTVHH
ncbi:hypothetical protein AD942_00510 [Gluconobacter japonicus]|nr:hypothetical protein AD936_15925 [Gluconobacter japonicus]KXV42112.1 hypothetical protein AD942_00510 [Gluconobacter japonicus]